MTDPEHVVRVIQEWLFKADNDLVNATHTLTLGLDCPTETVCFHAQQCVEKYLKALLVFQAIPVPKTHKIHVLMELIPRRFRPVLDDEVQLRITEYASVIRYPDEMREVSLAEARKAVALARRVRREIRKHLPRAALQRRRK